MGFMENAALAACQERALRYRDSNAYALVNEHESPAVIVTSLLSVCYFKCIIAGQTARSILL